MDGMVKSKPVDTGTWGLTLRAAGPMSSDFLGM